MNPASTSMVNVLQFGGSSNNGRFDADEWGVRFKTDSGYILFGPANSGHAHIYTDRSNFYFNKQLQVNGGSIINTSDIRSNIFYDKNSTSYYVDPASTSRLNNLLVTGNRIGFINTSFDAEIRVSDGNPNGAGAEFTFYGDTVSGNAQLTAEVGNFYNQIRSAIFYDHNNSAYYVDPNGTSNLNEVQVNSVSQKQYYIDVPGSFNGSYAWVRFNISRFNGGGSPVEMAISRRINDNRGSVFGFLLNQINLILINPNFIILLAVGFIAFSFFLMPGISGSAVLLSIGIYELIIGSIATLNMATLIPFAMGCLISLLTMPKIVHHLLDRFNTNIMTFFSGLILVSGILLFPSITL